GRPAQADRGAHARHVRPRRGGRGRDRPERSDALRHGRSHPRPAGRPRAARRGDRSRGGDPAPRPAHPPVREAPARVDAPAPGPATRLSRERPRGGGAMRPSEHDAVREARDALVVIGSVTPPVVILAALFGVATGQLDGFLRWIAGTLLMASIL